MYYIHPHLYDILQISTDLLQVVDNVLEALILGVDLLNQLWLCC